MRRLLSPASPRWTVAGMTTVIAGTVLTAGTANVKGSWAQLTSALPFSVDAILVRLGVGTAADRLVDLGVGPVGDEQVVVPDILFTPGTAGATDRHWTYWPIRLPSGSRLAARCQCVTGAATMEITCELRESLLGRHRQSGQQIEAWGAATADSGGTSVDPGATLHTKGAWSQLTASTGFPCRAIQLIPGVGSNRGRVYARWGVDVGIGPSGDEQLLAENVRILCTGSARDEISPFSGLGRLLPVPVPAGVRVAMRAQCSVTNSADRLFDVVGYGIR